MEDGAKENTALNIQKPLEILVTDEDKHGTDIACMSDFFGIYIEQLSAELSNQVMRGVVEKIPAADVQILGELVHGVDVLLSGKYGYIPDFDSLPNDVKDKLKKGIYTLGESRQVEDNVRAVVLDENGTRIKDVTLKRVLNTPDTLEMSRSITSQVQMRQIAAKLDEIAETQSYLIEMERNNNIIKPFLNARDLILRAQNAKTIDERKHYMIEASKELNDGMYYPDEDIFTHIDYTKNQYDIDTYLNKYSGCNEDMPIDTYTSSNELHYKIWCIEGGKYSRETWYRLMVVSLNQEYVELLDEILE